MLERVGRSAGGYFVTSPPRGISTASRIARNLCRVRDRRHKTAIALVSGLQVAYPLRMGKTQLGFETVYLGQAGAGRHEA